MKSLKDTNFSFFRKRYLVLFDYARGSKDLSSLLVFGFFLLFFLYIYMIMPVVSSGDDHFFHFRFAEQIAHNPDGFLDSFRDFKTLYFTNIADGGHFMYYNFLFYLVLIPFTYLTPLYLGIKLFAVMILALIGLILYSFIKDLGIKYPFLWSVGFFSVIGLGSYWRLFLSRPFVFSPLIILMLVWALHKKKPFWIFSLSFICLFWHTATFLVPLGVAVLYFLIHYFYERKWLWKELVLVFLGTASSVAVAMLIDPGFVTSIKDNLFGVLAEASKIGGNSANIQEGNEVYPKNFFDLFNQNIFLCSMFIIASVLYVQDFLWHLDEINILKKEIKGREMLKLFFFVMSSVFIVAIPLVSGRFADFFIFFGYIFVVLMFSEIFLNAEYKRNKLKKSIGYALIVCLLYIFIGNALNLKESIATNGTRPETFSVVGRYLSENLEEGEVVFNTDWSWFSQLYYYAPKQNYVIGLEPKLTYVRDGRLYWLWQNVGYGYVCEEEKCEEKESIRDGNLRNDDMVLKWAETEGDKIAEVVTQEFKSNYIVTSGDFSYLNYVLNNNQKFEKVVETPDRLYVYKISP